MSWGITRLILIKSSLYLTTFFLLKTNNYILLSIPFLYSSLITLLISLASHPSINLPILLSKSPDGSFPFWSLLLFSPFFAFVWVFSLLRRFLSHEKPYSEVCEGVYVGGWPCSVGMFPTGAPAVVDCTCEFPRVVKEGGSGYFCVPTWDTRSPQPEEIEAAVKWAMRKRAIGVPVFVHCAYGHGRSVAVTCALLVALGVVDNWKDAEKLIKERRPYIRMNSLHRQSLEEWSKHRLSPLKRKP